MMMRRRRRMERALERYDKIGLSDSFAVSYKYPIACNELSSIFRLSYSDLPKPLQSRLFQDALSAFRFLPQMQMPSAISAANNLIQSVEAALPKQKRVVAVKEFKHAMVAHKRRNKIQQEDKEMIELPEDILLHLFSFLDVQSLISAGMVCRSWNAAASDNCLWKVHDSTYFGNAVDDTICSFKDAFRRKYGVGRSVRFKHNRGHCRHCDSIVWITDFKCPNIHAGSRWGNQCIEAILSPKQIVDFVLNGSPPMTGVSDSDSDSDEDSGLINWVYPRHY